MLLEASLVESKVALPLGVLDEKVFTVTHHDFPPADTEPISVDIFLKLVENIIVEPIVVN